MNYVSLDGKKIAPSKVVCVGRNYVDHIKELGNEMPQSMVLFCKPNSSINEKLKFVSLDNHFEGEISFLIRDKGIAGVGFGLDITKRELQSKLKSRGLPWERAKAFDASAVFSEFVSFEGDVNSLRLELYINDTLVQSGGIELMIYKPDTILEEIESFISLEDGDIVMSGTPKGVGRYKRGDKFLGKILQSDKVIVQKEWIVI